MLGYGDRNLKRPNGDHGLLWDYMHHLNSRIDKLFIVVTGGLLTLIGLLVGVK